MKRTPRLVTGYAARLRGMPKKRIAASTAALLSLLLSVTISGARPPLAPPAGADETAGERFGAVHWYGGQNDGSVPAGDPDGSRGASLSEDSPV